MERFTINNFMEKSLLLLLSALLLFNEAYQTEWIIFILLTMLFSIFIWVVQEPKLSILFVLVMLLVSYWWKEYVFFVPFFFYDGGFDENHSVLIINSGLLFVFLLYNEQYELPIKFYVILLCSLAFYLAYRYVGTERLKEHSRSIEDELFAHQYTLQQQNEKQQERQEAVISLEVSNERNRIARDIHDNVGHLLSSSLLQLGAVQTINQSESLEKPLEQLKETIAEGMDNIRSSVHNLHDESLSLSIAMQKIINNFQFCKVELTGEFPEYLDKECKLACIMIVKEALSNVMKHSNADKVTIVFKQHPGFYKLMISDNGSKVTRGKSLDRGIGLISMEERLAKLGGRLNHHQTNEGFSLIAVFPKNKGENI
ncbi:sensor histidine kinase [Enterococcus sp. LJL128]|uniref:sensor histidine kinase n=1 Tax=Enterococcus sp. LJL51 TaxID=3416656 RepID=UPI003CF8F6D7